MPINYVKGDATNPVGEESSPKIIMHVCNNRGGWGKGFVLALSNRWTEPEKVYRDYFRKLGRDGQRTLGLSIIVPVGNNVFVANMIAQDGYKTLLNPTPLRYDFLKTCMGSVATFATEKNATVHCPRLGSGLSGGKWEIIELMISEAFKETEVYVYDLEG
jgi:O-acetyl-ADP-ribose deacetylase (regulator of RNase III)